VKVKNKCQNCQCSQKTARTGFLFNCLIFCEKKYILDYIPEKLRKKSEDCRSKTFNKPGSLSDSQQTALKRNKKQQLLTSA